ncbi:hypothetical protein TNCV_4460871 [Trichonephila clavipes]|nr:hypothetical protein TNCV_4460871 [Trichonephila clavipes]
MPATIRYLDPLGYRGQSSWLKVFTLAWWESDPLFTCPGLELVTATQGLLAKDHVILSHGQVTWTIPELAPPSSNYHTTPTGGRFSSRQI